MNYFDYLRLLKIKDTKEHFVTWLTKCKDYTKEEAEKEAAFYYYEEGKKKEVAKVDKIELLRDIIEGSKTFEFMDDDTTLKISSYYDNDKTIYVDFIELITLLKEQKKENINRILLTDYKEGE